MTQSKLHRARIATKAAEARLRRMKDQAGFATAAPCGFPYLHRTCEQVDIQTRCWWDGIERANAERTSRDYGMPRFTNDGSHESKSEQRRRQRANGIHPCPPVS